jgi:hypothetical protein
MNERMDDSSDGGPDNQFLLSSLNRRRDELPQLPERDGAANPSAGEPAPPIGSCPADHVLPDGDHPLDGTAGGDGRAEEEEEQEPLLRTMLERRPEEAEVPPTSIVQEEQPPPLASMRNVRGIRTVPDFSFFPEPWQMAVSYIHPVPLDIVVALDV